MAALNSTPIKSKPNQTIARAMSMLERELKKPETDALCSPGKVKQYLTLRLAKEAREVFTVLFLDAQNRLISADDLFFGTLTQTSVYPREVVKRALQHNAASVILAHNHPSGVAQPSKADSLLTDALKKALALIDVRVNDHIIVAGDQTYSFAEHDEFTKTANESFAIEHNKKHIAELSDHVDYGTGIGDYLQAYATDDKEVLSSIGDCVSDSAFVGLATVGKMLVHADMNELKDQAANIGWLVVLLSELGANASTHGRDACSVLARSSALKSK